MKHFLKTFSLLLVFSLALSACEKNDDGGDGMIEIFTESMGGGTKVLLDGANATWQDGDKILFNGEEVTVSRREGRAYIHAEAQSGANRAVYPASLASSPLTQDRVTLTLPAYYHYRTDPSTGKQILDLPMAAYFESGDKVVFKHLTGALYVTVTNTHSSSLMLHSISVSSSSYKLSGNKVVDLNNIESLSSETTSSNADKTVSVLFDTGYVLASNASVRVMIPVLPVGTNQRFTISVKSYDSTTDKFYVDSKSQGNASNDYSLQRNQLGYAPMNVSLQTESLALDKDDIFYAVRTPLEFKSMLKMIEERDSEWGNDGFKILEDIDMAGHPVSCVMNMMYMPKQINGNNHKISNLVINSAKSGSTTDYHCGLFSNLLGCKISDLTLEGLTLQHTAPTAYNLYMGALAATLGFQEANEPSEITNCTVSYSNIVVENVKTQFYFGGLIAELGNIVSMDISNCYVSIPPFSLTANVTSVWGGFIGSGGSNPINISSSTWEGDVSLLVSKTIKAGGLIGAKTRSVLSITGCTVNGSIHVTSGSNRYLGAFVGYFLPNSGSIFNQSNNNKENFRILIGTNSISVPDYSSTAIQ